MVTRNEIYWADLGGSAGRRPVVVLTRNAVAQVLSSVTVAPVTRTIRGIRSEVPLDRSHGLPIDCVANCDHVTTVPISSLDDTPVGSLDLAARVQLDRALRYALDIIG